MKKIMLSALMLAATCTFAQSENNWNWDWDFDQSNYIPIYYTPAESVNQINFTIQKKNGKIEKFEKTFNESGKLLSLSTYDKNDTKIPIVTYKYNAKNQITSSKSYKRGVLKKEMTKTRTDEDKPLEVIKRDSKGQIIYQKNWEYNTAHCVTKSEQYKKAGKLHRVWEYEYFSPCEKSKTVLKNGKGKSLHTWNYDCKEEGEKVIPKKKELQVCKYEESSNEYLVKVMEKTNAKGEVYRSIRKYTLSDTLLLESKKLDAEGRLIQLTTYDKDPKKPLVSKNYRKGKLRYSYDRTYENGNVVYKKHSFKNKVRSTYKYQYENNRMVEETRLDKNNKLKKKVSISYS